MTQLALTDTQLVLLSAAAQRDDLRIILPERLRGGAAQKVLTTLTGKGLIEALAVASEPRPLHEPDEPGATEFQLSQHGLASLGLVEPQEVPSPSEDEGKEDAAGAGSAEPTARPAPRSGTKLAGVIALLERPDGASIAELTTATGWLPHTTRAALTGLRKRGIAVVRSKREDGTTVYHLASGAVAATDGEVA